MVEWGHQNYLQKCIIQKTYPCKMRNDSNRSKGHNLIKHKLFFFQILLLNLINYLIKMVSLLYNMNHHNVSY